jgi:hypothetical protein
MTIDRREKILEQLLLPKMSHSELRIEDYNDLNSAPLLIGVFERGLSVLVGLQESHKSNARC